MSALDAVAVFVKVVESGSFSRAARLLGMPNTTVSAKVAALEKQLGVKLIQRTTRKLHVTEAGSKYFAHCANAIRELELGQAALQSSQGQPSGLLKVTAPVDIGHVVLPKIAAAYLARYPGTSVELLISNRIVDLVGEGIDLAIRAGTLKDSSLIAKRFINVRGALFAAPRLAKQFGGISHPRQLSKAMFVGLRGFERLRLTNGRAEAELSTAGRVLTDDLEANKAMAILGEGIAWLPDFLAEGAVAAGELAPVLPGWSSKGMNYAHFVYPGRKYISPKVQAFMDIALHTMSGAGAD